MNTRAPADDARRRALEAVLLFHSGVVWDDARREEWKALTGSGDATTRALCDFVRAALAETDTEVRALQAGVLEAVRWLGETFAVDNADESARALLQLLRALLPASERTRR